MMHDSIWQGALCLAVSLNAAALARFKRLSVQMVAGGAMFAMFQAAADGSTFVLALAAALWVGLSFFPRLRRPDGQADLAHPGGRDGY